MVIIFVLFKINHPLYLHQKVDFEQNRKFESGWLLFNCAQLSVGVTNALVWLKRFESYHCSSKNNRISLILLVDGVFISHMHSHTNIPSAHSLTNTIRNLQHIRIQMQTLSKEIMLAFSSRSHFSIYAARGFQRADFV